MIANTIMAVASVLNLILVIVFSIKGFSFQNKINDDNKQFHRDIMESKRGHNKMIANMSALTAALIKKGMQL